MQPLGCMRASKDERSRPCPSHLASGARHPSRLARHSALKTRVNALMSARSLLRMTALASSVTSFGPNLKD